MGIAPVQNVCVEYVAVGFGAFKTYSVLKSLIIHTPFEVHALLGVVLVADHLGVDAGQIEVGGLVFAAAGDDHFGFRWFAQQRLHDRFLRQQLQIHRWVEFIEDHGFVEPA